MSKPERKSTFKESLSPEEWDAHRKAARAKNITAENERLASVVAAGLAPNECGPEMVGIAPARGRVRAFRNPTTYLDTDGQVETIDHGEYGRSAMRREDVFDLMIDQAAKRKRQAPYTIAQIAIGRDYRDLTEKHECAGVKCSSIEGLPGGGGSGGGIMDAVLREGEQLARWHQLIGDGLALDIRRVRPSTRGERIAIKARVLVDMVCLGDQSITQVLDRHGWSNSGNNINKLTAAFIDILTRMSGPEKPSKIQTKHFGEKNIEAQGYQPVLDKEGELVAGHYTLPTA